MTDEHMPEKAHDIDKNDPDYKIKVHDVLQRRFEEEKKKSYDREKAKMDEGRKKVPTSSHSPVESRSLPLTDQNIPMPPTNPPSNQVDQRDPDEYVKRKDIVALVNNINKSFAIIEKHRVKVEAFMEALKESLNK